MHFGSLPHSAQQLRSVQKLYLKNTVRTSETVISRGWAGVLTIVLHVVHGVGGARLAVLQKSVAKLHDFVVQHVPGSGYQRRWWQVDQLQEYRDGCVSRTTLRSQPEHHKYLTSRFLMNAGAAKGSYRTTGSALPR